MKKFYFWSKDYGALQFPISKTQPKLIADDFGDLPIVSSVRDMNTVNIKVSATSNLEYTKNQTLFEKFLLNITTENVKVITKMTNKFKVFVDFVIYDENRNIVEEGVKIHQIDCISDTVRLFDADSDNICNYINEKQFSANISLLSPGCQQNVNTRGILLKSPIKFLRIRQVMIGAQIEQSSTPNGVAAINRTIMDKVIHYTSPTIDDIKDECVIIYNSYASSFGTIDFGMAPRMVNLELYISVSGFLSVSKDGEKKISDALYKNNHPDEPDIPDVPDTPNVPDEPSEYFSQFERCSEDNPKAGKVISDIEYDEGQYEGRCYPYSKVVLDISDINIGEYVEYVESLILSSL